MAFASPVTYQSGYVSPVVLVTGAITITPAQSGTLFSLTTSAGGAFTCTLPPPAAGLNFKFSVLTRAAANNVTIASSTGTIIFGYLIGFNTVVACTGVTNINIIQANAKQGDLVELWADGLNWNVRGFFQTAAAVTAT